LYHVSDNITTLRIVTCMRARVNIRGRYWNALEGVRRLH